MPANVSTPVAGADVESLGARDVIAHMLDRFHPRLALACSFQKEETVILDMLLEQRPDATVFALDTHVLFPETYAVWQEIEKRYNIKVRVYEGPPLDRQAATHGDELWKSNPSLCCALRKVAPLANALGDLDGWITGVRRDQSTSRAQTPKIGWDERHELWKAAPLADWSDADVWAYIEERNLPVNDLHRRGYASIGCTHCTLPGQGREGRWAGTDKTECGLHR
jgi:phosphoadenosine phosphosulfate reductase